MFGSISSSQNRDGDCSWRNATKLRKMPTILEKHVYKCLFSKNSWQEKTQTSEKFKDGPRAENPYLHPTEKCSPPRHESQFQIGRFSKTTNFSRVRPKVKFFSEWCKDTRSLYRMSNKRWTSRNIHSIPWNSNAISSTRRFRCSCRFCGLSRIFNPSPLW